MLKILSREHLYNWNYQRHVNTVQGLSYMNLSNLSMDSSYMWFVPFLSQVFIKIINRNPGGNDQKMGKNQHRVIGTKWVSIRKILFFSRNDAVLKSCTVNKTI